MARLCRQVRDELEMSVRDFATLIGASECKVRLLEAEGNWGHPETNATRMQLELLIKYKSSVNQQEFEQFVQHTVETNVRAKYKKALKVEDDDEI